MKRRAFLILVSTTLLFSPFISNGVEGEKKESVTFIANGKPVGTIIIPKEAPASVVALASYFVETVERSTGAKLPMIRDDQESTVETGHPRLYLGDCIQRTKAGLSHAQLAPETYQITVHDNAVYIAGEPAKSISRKGNGKDPWYDSDPIRWAVNQLLQEQLGVRWLWPGKLGTYVPKHPDFAIPSENRTYQPKLAMRTLVIATMRTAEEATLRAEGLEWVSNHQGGERGDIPLTHGFNDWWEKYHQTHPDYFATPPAGEKQRDARYVKLNLTNPKVLDQIEANYIAAGKPRYWNVTPNDGTGFDVSDEVRTWDLPPNQDPLSIWRAQVNLTPRYVKWWNMIYDRLKASNPDVTLVTMAYSAYRTPPPKERPLTAKAIIGIVPSYRAYDVWSGWANYTDRMILRPNWGHYGANGPHLSLNEISAYMKFAAKNKMIGFYLDSILGYWGTQGVNYYLMARLMVDPELPVKTIIKEYASAFGAGAPKIEAYINYWQALTTEWAHGHKVYKDPNGKYDQLIEKRLIMDNPIIGPRQALPYIYTDEVLAKAYTLLNEADGLIGTSDPEARQRVDFLRKGLNELKMTRDAIALGHAVEKKPTKEGIKALTQQANALEKLRTDLSPSHVIWGAAATRREDRSKIKIRPRNLTLPTSSGDDQF